MVSSLGFALTNLGLLLLNSCQFSQDLVEIEDFWTLYLSNPVAVGHCVQKLLLIVSRQSICTSVFFRPLSLNVILEAVELF